MDWAVQNAEHPTVRRVQVSRWLRENPNAELFFDAYSLFLSYFFTSCPFLADSQPVWWTRLLFSASCGRECWTKHKILSQLRFFPPSCEPLSVTWPGFVCSFWWRMTLYSVTPQINPVYSENRNNINIFTFSVMLASVTLRCTDNIKAHCLYLWWRKQRSAWRQWNETLYTACLFICLPLYLSPVLVYIIHEQWRVKSVQHLGEFLAAMMSIEEWILLPL